MNSPSENRREMTDAEYLPLAVEITISDFDKSFSFYRDKLGFSVAHTYQDPDYKFATKSLNVGVDDLTS